MSHERGSTPTAERDPLTVRTPLHRLFDRVRAHVRTWPRRYVEMRVGERP